MKEGQGKIKEYECNDKLIFEGELLNGKRNGNGKEYYNYANGKLLFEMEYLNGEILNGKLYNNEGIMKLGIKNGKIIKIKE